MARRKKEQESTSTGDWITTFSDLMNLLFCFFVLLFAMSNMEQEKFDQIAASFTSSYSIFPGGGASVGTGVLISNGVSQLNELSQYYNNMGLNAQGQQKQIDDLKQQMEREQLELSETLAGQLEDALEYRGLASDVEVQFTSQYVQLTMNGALLFDSGDTEIRRDSRKFMDKIGDILQQYDGYLIEIEGHTDNVPVSNRSRYANNSELSSFRAMSVSNYLIEEKGIDPVNLKYSGRGEYVPIASNDTPEGRAQNRRVEIRLYHQLH